MPTHQYITPSQALSHSFVLPKLEKAKKREQKLIRGFKISGLGLLVKGTSSMELLDTPDIFPLPKAHQTCLGLINLRGVILPLFDFRQELNQQNKIPLRWVLVFTEHSKTVAFVIDDLPVQILMEEVEPLDSIPQMPAFFEPFILSGISVDKQHFYFELDHYALLQSLKN